MRQSTSQPLDRPLSCVLQGARAIPVWRSDEHDGSGHREYRDTRLGQLFPFNPKLSIADRHDWDDGVFRPKRSVSLSPTKDDTDENLSGV